MTPSVFRAVSSTLSIPKYQRFFPPAFLGSLVLSAFLLNAASLASLVLDRELVVNPLLEPAGVVFLFLFALLLALAVVLNARRYDQEKAFGKSGKTALAGFLASLFTSACPVCPPLLASLLGVPAALAFLPFDGWPVRVLALALLALSLHLAAKPLAGEDETKTRSTAPDGAAPATRT